MAGDTPRDYFAKMAHWPEAGWRGPFPMPSAARAAVMFAKTQRISVGEKMAVHVATSWPVVDQENDVQLFNVSRTAEEYQVTVQNPDPEANGKA